MSPSATKLFADKEAEFAAAKEAIKLRYEMKLRLRKMALTLRLWLKCKPKKLKKLTKDFEQSKNSFNALEKLSLINETDYRNLPDELRELISRYGWRSLKELLDRRLILRAN
jgi:hypothetical protein